MRNPRPSRSAGSRSIEQLESRIAPAGLVAIDYIAGTGALTVSGDADANYVTIYRTGPASYRIEGINDTAIHSAAEAFYDIGKLTRVLINGGGGSDQFQLDDALGLTSLSVTLPAGEFDSYNLNVKGSVDINGGLGGNYFSIDGTTVIGGNLAISDVGGSNDVVFGGSTKVKGAITYLGGADGDGINTQSVTSISAGKGFFFDGAAGANSMQIFAPLTLGKGTGGASLKIQNTGTFSGTISSSVLSMAGFLEVDGLSNQTQLSIFAGALTINGKNSEGQSLAFHGSAAADSLTVNASRISLAGGAFFQGGDGNNTLQFGSETSSIKLGAADGKISFAATGGANDDKLNLDAQSLTLAGGIDVQSGDGSNELFIAVGPSAAKIGKSTLGRSLAYTVGAGFGELRLSLTKGKLTGAVHLEAGTGSVLLEESGSVKIGKESAEGHSLEVLGPGGAYFGGQSLSLKGGIFVDSPSVASAASFIYPILGSLVIGKSLDGTSVNFAATTGEHQFGAYDADITLYDTGSVVLRGAMKFAGGEGADIIGLPFTSSITIPEIDFHGGDGDNVVNLIAPKIALGTVNVTGGADTDIFNLRGDGKVTGNVSIDLGAAFDQTVQLAAFSRLPGSLKLGGTLTVKTATAAASTEEITLTNVAVAKDILLALGDADSTVTIDNLFASGALTVQTKGGTDSVQIERGAFFGGSVFKKAVAIDLGAGTDTLRIGRGTIDDQVTAKGTVTLEGGSGADNYNMNIETQNDFTSPAMITGFEFPLND